MKSESDRADDSEDLPVSFEVFAAQYDLEHLHLNDRLQIPRSATFQNKTYKMIIPVRCFSCGKVKCVTFKPRVYYLTLRSR